MEKVMQAFFHISYKVNILVNYPLVVTATDQAPPYKPSLFPFSSPQLPRAFKLILTLTLF